MMAALRSWLVSVVAAAFFVSLAQRIIPEGSLRKIASVTGGMILLLTLVQPLAGWREQERLSWDYSAYRRRIETQQAALEQVGQEALSAAVAEKTEACIRQQAERLGIACTVSVETQARESDGLPVPWSVVLECPPSAELQEWLEREMNIPLERQVYSGTEETGREAAGAGEEIWRNCADPGSGDCAADMAVGEQPDGGG